MNDITLAARGFGFKADEGDAQADTLVLRQPTLSGDGGSTLKPGRCRGVQLRLVDNAPTLDAGSYTGVLSAVAKGVGVARREITITGAPAQTSPPASVTDTVKIKLVHTFSLLHRKRGPETRYVTVKAPPDGKELDVAGACQGEEKAPSKACPAIGVVAHDEDTSEIWVGGTTPKAENGVVKLPVRLGGTRVVGDYQGTIDPSQGGDEKQAIKVTVSVTDGWWCALVALLIGCVVALVIQLFALRITPKEDVEDKADALEGRYGEAVAFPGVFPPGANEVIEYAKEIKASLKTYLKGMVFLDKTTDTYKQIEKSIKIAEDDAGVWSDGSLEKALTALRAALDENQDWLDGHDFGRAKTPAVGKAAAAVLKPRALRIGEAADVEADAEAATALLEDWLVCAKRLLRLQLWWRWIGLDETRDDFTMEDSASYAKASARIAQAKRDLLEVEDADALKARHLRRRLDAIDELVSDLGYRYFVEEPGLNAAPGEMAGKWTLFRVAGTDVACLKQEATGEAPGADALIRAADTTDRTPARVAEVRSSKRWLSDVAIILFAAGGALYTATAALVDGKNFGTVGTTSRSSWSAPPRRPSSRRSSPR